MNKDDKAVMAFAILMIIFLVFVFIPSHAMADSFRAPDGASCQFDSDDSNAEIEVYVESDDSDYRSTSSASVQNGFEAGIKFTYKIGVPKRLDCSRLYDSYLAKLEAQVKKLEAASNSKVNWE